jgi:hydroxypyruvate isomerase
VCRVNEGTNALSFSANLGLLFTDLALPEAIRAAHRAGFAAVECHWPYDTPPSAVAQALQETGLPMLCLNTRPGNRAAGEFGLAALPKREAEARSAIAEALAYATATGTRAVHVMAGLSDAGAEAEAMFRANLAHACDLAAARDLTILIEPINPRDVPGYHLSCADQASAIIADLARPNLKMIFDCYHLAIIHGDLPALFAALQPIIGHVQFAALPDRGEPDRGEIDYAHLLPAFRAAGHTQPFGAEYHPRSGRTEDGLGWLSTLGKALTNP